MVKQPAMPPKKKAWYWLGLLPVLLLIAVLVWALTRSSSTPPTKPDPGVDPIPEPGIRFERFDKQISGDANPWCIATRYRIAYIVNGVESEPDPSVEVGPSSTETDPVFSLTLPAGVDAVKWYRAEAPSFVWRDHTSRMEEVPSQKTTAYYIDHFNPCDEPPTRPEPFGTFGGMWNATASEGALPWCVPTRYRARYVRGERVSAWSEESIEFESQIYTQPGVKIVNPAPGSTIEWIVSSNITLPAGNSGSGRNPTDDRDAQNFKFIDVDESGSYIKWTFWLQLADFWVPGSTSLTIPLTDFVNEWNTNVEYDPALKELRITPEGKLALDPIPSNQSDAIELSDEDWPGWWMEMGFNQFEPTNQPIVASRLPRSTIVHTGSQFVDTNNMCRPRNSPSTRPRFVGWDVVFHPFFRKFQRRT